MKQLKKYIVSIALICSISGYLFAQDDSPIQFGADVMSRYIWRGINVGGNSPSIQPWMKFTVNPKDTTHSIALGVWGAVSTSQLSTQEVDLLFSYTYKNMITFWFTDYFFPSDLLLARNKYFNYNSKTTGHVFEPCITFNGTEKIPFTFNFSMNIYGADKRRKILADTGGYTDGKIFMTKYVEVGYRKNIKGVDFCSFVGAVLDDPKEEIGELGFYGDNRSAGIINVGIKACKKIKITEKYSLPVQAQFIVNPEAENAYFVFGISF